MIDSRVLRGAPSARMQQRREKDEQRIAELKSEIIKVEKTLSAEIKRGLERNKSIQVVRGRGAVS
jgi:flagellar motility protein MotE (MotC chaperone)